MPKVDRDTEHALPPGFRPHTGKRRPPDKDQAWFVQIGNGFWSTEKSYVRDDLVWLWANPDKPHAGDIIGYREA